MNKAERAINALREAADAHDALPLALKGQSLFGPMISPKLLREEADRIENKMEAFKGGLEDVNPT